MKNVLTLLAIIVLFAACKTNTQVQDEAVSEASTVKKESKTEFGEVKKVKDVISYDALLAKMEKTELVENVQVEGKVSAVCQAKGCWMTINSEDESKQKMMVKFKDYGFFMPLDLSGSTVVMQGKAFIETTSVDELRHYAEDAGKTKEEIAKIIEPKVELKFEATGVVVKDKA